MAVTDINSLTYGGDTFNLKDPTKYQKPATGIPQTDLAQTVQNKLDKTVVVSNTQPTESENKLWVDTDAGSGNSYEVPTVAESLAMGMSGASVGDLVRVNAVDANGKPTSWKHVPLNEIKCNKNLLDNWYFVGGGSQLGDGVFPINQRGQTTYSGIGYGFDRWRLATDIIVSIATEIVVRNTSSTDRRSFGQYCESPSNLYGKTVTGSILLSNGEMYYGTITLPTSIPSGRTNNISFIDFNNNTLCAEVETSGLIKFSLMIAQDSSLSVLAMKLELGSEQTLAHNEGTEENPAWVLNEIPDYGEELRKCQRYYQLFRTESLRPTYGEDCRPTMATERPTKGTLTKGGLTYYTLSSEP